MPPKAKIDFQKINVKKLEETDDISSFNCSQDDYMGLHEFIHEEALDFKQNRLGITYLFYYKGKIIGFVTLSMADIRAEQIEEEQRIPTYIKTFPSLYIGRIAVDNNYRKLGVGYFMIRWCIGFAMNISEDIGCRYITLHTRKELIEFYTKCNFASALGEEKYPTILMYQRLI
jgi:GNAT superfamily N-acetyltransferase